MDRDDDDVSLNQIDIEEWRQSLLGSTPEEQPETCKTTFYFFIGRLSK
jgi:hypothetical protein